MLNLAYQYRLRPSKEQVQRYEDWLEASRKVWHYALLSAKIGWSRSCKVDSCSLQDKYIIPADAPRPTFASQCKALTQA